MFKYNSVLVALLMTSVIISACGDDGDQDSADSSILNTAENSDEFVAKIASQINGLGGSTELLNTYAQYEQFKSSSEDQFFQAQLERIVEFSPSTEQRDREKIRSLASIDSATVTLCQLDSEEGYIGSGENKKALGFCSTEIRESMSSEDAVRFLSYVLKSKEKSSPIRQITSVRLNRKIRMVFEESRPLYHIILSEKIRGGFGMGDPDIGSNGLEGGLAPILIAEDASEQIAANNDTQADASSQIIDSSVTEAIPETEVAPDPKPEVEPEIKPEVKPEAEVIEKPLPDLSNLVTSYLDLQETSNIEAIMNLYGDRVSYNTNGRVSKNSVRTDKQNYFKRWPIRSHSRTSNVTVKKGSTEDTFVARFNYSYNLNDGTNTADGRVWMELTVLDSNGSYKIVGERGGSL